MDQIQETLFEIYTQNGNKYIEEDLFLQLICSFNRQNILQLLKDNGETSNHFLTTQLTAQTDTQNTLDEQHCKTVSAISNKKHMTSNNN